MIKMTADLDGCYMNDVLVSKEGAHNSLKLFLNSTNNTVPALLAHLFNILFALFNTMFSLLFDSILDL